MFHMKQFTSKSQKIGEYGESICAKWLENNRFGIIDRNYTTRSGEIDIIASKEGVIHFIEVKSVSCETTEDLENQDVYNPAENMTQEKIKRCFSAISEYKSENQLVSHETQLDLYMVFIDQRNLKHKIQRIENIFL